MIGTNGSLAHADIASGTPVAMMRNRFDGGMTAAETVPRPITAAYD